MLLVENLWFLVRVVVAGFTLLFLPLFGFVVRRKWRRSAARREEIKRLLVLASEETARAELKANQEYGYGGINYGQEDMETGVELEPEPEPEPELEPEQQGKEEEDVLDGVKVPLTDNPSVNHQRTQNQCDVCSRPTTARCARCKRVYYCSGKCQINHWRQGHKDECRPFSTSVQNNDFGDPSHSKPMPPPESGSYTRSTDVGGKHPVKRVETLINECSFSGSNIVKEVDWNDDNEVVHLNHLKRRPLKSKYADEHSGVASISKSAVNVSANDVNNCNSSGRHHFIHKDFDETNLFRMDKIKPVSSEDTCALCSEDTVATFKNNLVKPSLSHGDSQTGSSSSSSLTDSSVDECNESSFSETSTRSSGFWEGVNDFIGVRNDDLDDTAPCFNETVDVDADASDSHLIPSSPELTGMVLPFINAPVSHVTNVVLSDIRPAISGVKVSIDRHASSIETEKQAMKAQRLSVSERSVADVDDISSNKLAAPGKSKEQITATHSRKNIPPFVQYNKPNREAGHESSTFTEPKSVEVKSLLSKASGEFLSSAIAKQTAENVKSAKADSIHVVPAKADFLVQQKDRTSSKSTVWKVFDQVKTPKLAKLNPFGTPSESVGRYTGKGLFQYELFVKLYNWNKVELLPCGLINCGNSCYANVVLQCLAFTPPLTAYFLQGLHSHECKKRDWCFTCEYERLLLKAKEGHSPISPSQIISQLQSIGSHLRNGREEDAHEFLRYAIDAMQLICLTEAGVSASSSLDETTLIGLTFGGYLRSKIKCLRCGAKSERQEKMMDLTVEIEGDIGTLEEALRQFTRSETLDGENKYQCGRCKSFEKARKKLRVLEAPNVLTIALKRFQSGKSGKLSKTIKFPEILNMAPYMSGTSDKSPVYRLYGVVVHLNSMNFTFSGHYVCYVKNSQNRWFKIDDSTVKAVELERVLTEGAYMLFYARCSPRAPRLLRSSINPCDSRKAKDADSKAPFKNQWGVSSPSDLPSESSRNERSRLNRDRDIQSPSHMVMEEDSSSSDNSSFFSDVNSRSTDNSSIRESASIEYMDQIFGDMGASYWRNSSDSETISSTSSPSPMYSRHSSYGDLDHYSSVDAAESAAVSRPSHQLETAESKGRAPLLCPGSTKHRRSVGSCSSSSSSSFRCSRDFGSSKVGGVNSLGNLKSSVPFRRSSREGRI